MAVLSLCCCADFSRLAASRGYLHGGARVSRGGSSRWRARALGPTGAIAGALGLVVLQHVRSSRTRDQTRVPCTGRRVLNP